MPVLDNQERFCRNPTLVNYLFIFIGLCIIGFAFAVAYQPGSKPIPNCLLHCV
jgi:hypothetical protein